MTAPPRIHSFRPTLILLLFTLCTWTGPAGAQNASGLSQDLAFTDRLDVSLVNVEVWVTDKDGNPVTGLLADDFEVFEDGAPVEVSFFAEYRADSELARFSLAAPEPGQAPQPEASADPVDPDLPEGHLVFYLDEVHSGPSGRARLVKDLEDFFEANPVPAENVLILRQQDSLVMDLPFGSGKRQLRQVIGGLKEGSSEGQKTWADDTQAIRRLQDLWEQEVLAINSGPGGDPCSFFVPKAFREVQFYVQTAGNRVRSTLRNLTDAATFLAGIPGPKTLVYLSDGLPMAPGTGLLSFVKSMCPGEDPFLRLDILEGLNAEFREMTRHAAANRVTFYTLQTSGMRAVGGLSGADQRGLANSNRAIARFDSEHRIQQREGLSLLAEETGGRAMFNRNRFLDELDRVAENMKGYYSLAYLPRHGGDGLEHRIKVKLADRKLRVRHRPGYRDKSADQRMIENLESTLFLNLMANPLSVRLGVGTVRDQGKKGFVVPMHVRVPSPKLTFLPQKGGEQSRVSVHILAQNERRKQTAALRRVFDIPKPADGSDISMVGPLELKDGVHVIAVGIRDEASLEASFVSTGIQLEDPS